MNENPFQSPTSAPNTADSLRNVATYQRGVLLCILLQLASIPVNIALRDSSSVLVLLVSVAVLGIVVVGTVFLFLLAKALYSTATAILLAILSIIPCIGLLVLLLVNIQATKVLRQNGIKVGLMGADMSQF